jgi:hypothetical protein
MVGSPAMNAIDRRHQKQMSSRPSPVRAQHMQSWEFTTFPRALAPVYNRGAERSRAPVRRALTVFLDGWHGWQAQHQEVVSRFPCATRGFARYGVTSQVQPRVLAVWVPIIGGIDDAQHTVKASREPWYFAHDVRWYLVRGTVAVRLQQDAP